MTEYFSSTIQLKSSVVWNIDIFWIMNARIYGTITSSCSYRFIILLESIVKNILCDMYNGRVLYTAYISGKENEQISY